jgi:hypothetical protein
MINKYRTRMTVLREAFARDGYLYATSRCDETYAIFLNPNGSSSAPWRVTSFWNGEPIGHREYNMLEGGSAIQNAFQEFASSDFQLRPRGAIMALCVRTRVIGTGNSFEVLIPLAEISAEGQTYRVVRPDRGNREYVPFHLGIEPYTSQIIHMPPGFVRYEAYKAHEAASKAKELAILQHAFPESHLDSLPMFWNGEYLADKQVTVRIDREGNLLRPGMPRPVSRPIVSPG